MYAARLAQGKGQSKVDQSVALLTLLLLYLEFRKVAANPLFLLDLLYLLYLLYFYRCMAFALGLSTILQVVQVVQVKQDTKRQAFSGT
jgi:hypothetical protein